MSDSLWRFCSPCLFSASSLGTSSAHAQERGTGLSEWYEDLIFEDKSFSSQLARNLAWTYAGAADIG